MMKENTGFLEEIIAKMKSKYGQDSDLESLPGDQAAEDEQQPVQGGEMDIEQDEGQE